MAENTATIQESRVILSADDARKLRDKAAEVKRYHLSSRYYADKCAEAADDIIRLMDLIIKNE